MMLNIFHRLTKFVLGYMITIGIIFCTQWTYYNYLDSYQLPFVEEPIPILNENNEIAVGEPIKMRLVINKPEAIKSDGSVNITCDDGNLITLASNATTLPVGRFNVTTESYRLPAKATVGAKCHFNFVNTYYPNPYKTEVIKWASETFKVVE